jgi:GMP synthase (glutamine-hydrolysing)
VKGDLRAYEWPVMLCGLLPRDGRPTSVDNWELVLEAANRIYREVSGVNRCIFDPSVHDVTPHLEPLPATVTRARLDVLREADSYTMESLAKHGLLESIWQCPTVALPVCVDGLGREYIVIRPVYSERAMTARPALLPSDLLQLLRSQVLAIPGVSGFAIDVTTKPPGTIEWE